jgi:hypothetical protein
VRRPALPGTAADRENGGDAADRESRGDAYPVLSLDPDAIAKQVAHMNRLFKLQRCLQVEVWIDTIGWLRGDIEIIVDKDLDGTLWPVKVRVGADLSDDVILERGGPVAECVRYNAALGRLRQLAGQLATLVRKGHAGMAPGSPLEYAHAQLARLDELIADRQRRTMERRVVRLQTLRREIEFFLRCDAQLTPIVLAAERATTTTPPEKPAAPARSLWMRLGRRKRRS